MPKCARRKNLLHTTPTGRGHPLSFHGDFVSVKCIVWKLLVVVIDEELLESTGKIPQQGGWWRVRGAAANLFEPVVWARSPFLWDFYFQSGVLLFILRVLEMYVHLHLARVDLGHNGGSMQFSCAKR